MELQPRAGGVDPTEVSEPSKSIILYFLIVKPAIQVNIALRRPLYPRKQTQDRVIVIDSLHFFIPVTLCPRGEGKTIKTLVIALTLFDCLIHYADLTICDV